MKYVILFFGNRNYNFVDMFFVVMAANLASKGEVISTLVVMIIGIIVSYLAEKEVYNLTNLKDDA